LANQKTEAIYPLTDSKTENWSKT